MKNTTYAQGRGWGTLSGPACGDPITMKTEYTREYLAYCKANGLTPEDQSARDKKQYPGGCMCGFICWMSDRVAEFKHIHPEHFIGTNISNHDAKCDYLEKFANECAAAPEIPEGAHFAVLEVRAIYARTA